MDRAFLEKIRLKLEEERELIKTQLAQVASPDIGDHVPGEYAATYPNYGDDNLDENTASPQEVAEYAENVDLTFNLSQRLKEIERALEKIDTNEYGYCEKCKGEIPRQRLEVNPAAVWCVDCSVSS